MDFIEQNKTKINKKMIISNLLVLVISVALTLVISHFMHKDLKTAKTENRKQETEVEVSEDEKFNNKVSQDQKTAIVNKLEVIDLGGKIINTEQTLKELEGLDISPKVKEILIRENKAAIEENKKINNSAPLREPRVGKIYGDYYNFGEMGHGGIYGPASRSSRVVRNGIAKVGEITLLIEANSTCADIIEAEIPYQLIDDVIIQQCKKIDSLSSTRSRR